MKTILGLDLGVSSIGWALVKEAENNNEKSSIIKVGVRVNPITADEKKNFEDGKSITTNASRTQKRQARRNLQRYKLRRAFLIETLINNNIITKEDILYNDSNKELFNTYKLRASSVNEMISLEDFAKVLLMINKKRGYKSSRKANNAEDGTIVDGMDVALYLYENHLTPGEYCYNLLLENKKHLPDFYPSDLRDEFDRIWEKQKIFHPNLLNESLKSELFNKTEKQTWSICQKYWEIVGIKRETKGDELKKENYKLRKLALTQKLNLEELAIVFQKINSQLNSTSGYLGKISDRSKELIFNKITVGQFLYNNLISKTNYSTKNVVFYRQDYLDEFEKIWEKQASYHKELTPELKHQIRDVIIFYQRPLKSQKSQINLCEFENKIITIEDNGVKKTKTIGCRVIPKSSPLYQEFKIWQILNNVQVSGNVINIHSDDLFGIYDTLTNGKRFLTQEEKLILYKELNIKERLSKNEALKLLFKEIKGKDLNYNEIDGNKTNAKLFKAFNTIISYSGHGDDDFSKMPANEVIEKVRLVFEALGINTQILNFDSSLQGLEFENQASYQLWHLLYSFEGDDSKTGNDKLVQKLTSLYGFSKEYSKTLANISFKNEYGSLSAKAIRKILPFLKEGQLYSDACQSAGYKHSKSSLTKDEIKNKELIDELELLPKNSLRNPVVEKIINQMINLINAVSNEYCKPDEIRIEMARELKKTQQQREELSSTIRKTTAEYEEYKKELSKELPNISRNDIIRYKLYLELEANGFKTLYSNTYIPREKLFSKEFDIEHIIPQAKLFDDSFSNKTLELRSVNLEKSNLTAFDYMLTKGEDALNNYKTRIEDLFNKKIISKAKKEKLLTPESEIPKDFLNRDLSDSQYIAKKAKEILEQYVKVVTPTTGSVTNRLREDWQLINVMKELNWDKYNAIGLTEFFKDKDGRTCSRIIDWTKRNDHRHHAMDALTIAFTKPAYIQYLNNINAKSNKAGSIYAISQKYLDDNKFISPILPLESFRAIAKEQLNNTLVSIKAKNKVVTKNTNKTKKDGGFNILTQLTPRGKLHEETIYGKIKRYITKEESIGASFTLEKINSVASKTYRGLLIKRLEEFNNDPKKAFTGKNSLKNNPIYVNPLTKEVIPDKVKTVSFETMFTKRKVVSKDLNIDKVVDVHVREILKARLLEYNNDKNKAFSNLSENPIWLNKEKGIEIKSVKVMESLSNCISIHNKKDINGNDITDGNNKLQECDFVNSGGNHHSAIFIDNNENLQEEMVSFYEATTRALSNDSIVNKTKNSNLGWKFLFTLKQNEYFVFPNEKTGFNPNDIDLLNPNNYSIISPNLFRVQTISSNDYKFRHHLETTVDNNILLKDITWKRISSLNKLKGIIKVRINNLGKIVSVGEY